MNTTVMATSHLFTAFFSSLSPRINLKQITDVKRFTCYAQIIKMRELQNFKCKVRGFALCYLNEVKFH